MGKTERSLRIGQKMTALRGIRTRTGVSKETGISYSALSNYENGVRIPSDDVKQRLADYYNVSVQDLFFSE